MQPCTEMERTVSLQALRPLELVFLTDESGGPEEPLYEKACPPTAGFHHGHGLGATEDLWASGVT